MNKTPLDTKPSNKKLDRYDCILCFQDASDDIDMSANTCDCCKKENGGKNGMPVMAHEQCLDEWKRRNHNSLCLYCGVKNADDGWCGKCDRDKPMFPFGV